MTLGQKIKEQRKALKMTQSALAGEDITRNMLSAIEHDTALPSLSTLKALAQRLNVSASYLLSDEDDLFFYQKNKYLSVIQDLYQKEKYRDCLDKAAVFFGDRNDSETAFLRADASCKEAEIELHSGSMKKAATLAQNTLDFAKQTVYDTAHLKASAMLYLAIARNPQSPRLELNDTLYVTCADVACENDLYHYLTDHLHYTYRNNAMQTHMKARQLMQNGRFDEAYRQMSKLEERKENESSFVLFRVYGDMEICARNRRDFENAYRLSTKRMSLLSAFKS